MYAPIAGGDLALQVWAISFHAQLARSARDAFFSPSVHQVQGVLPWPAKAHNQHRFLLLRGVRGYTARWLDDRWHGPHNRRHTAPHWPSPASPFPPLPAEIPPRRQTEGEGEEGLQPPPGLGGMAGAGGGKKRSRQPRLKASSQRCGARPGPARPGPHLLPHGSSIRSPRSQRGGAPPRLPPDRPGPARSGLDPPGG